ncbi:YqhR family membrane protein [Bacillus sp. Hm123]|uniref:YqhR family membrane protein n=1 Tax=Bacillus sp. Hm123 TaxID=3450745 RepID=UPI003F433E5E
MMEKDVKQAKEIHFPLKNVILIGFYGGLFWGAIAQFVAYFNFISFNPNAVLKYMHVTEFKKTYLNVGMSILFYIICSLILAFIYYALFRRKKSMWVGVMYGASLWVIFFVVLRSIYPAIPWWRTMNNDTLITTICLLLLYGLFIGYSISYGYEHHKRMNVQAEETE